MHPCLVLAACVNKASAMLLGGALTSCDGPLLGQVCPFVDNYLNTTRPAAALGVARNDVLAPVSLALLFMLALLIIRAGTVFVQRMLPDSNELALLIIRDLAQTLAGINPPRQGAPAPPPAPIANLAQAMAFPVPAQPARRRLDFPAPPPPPVQGPAAPKTPGPGIGSARKTCRFCGKTSIVASAQKHCRACGSADAFRRPGL